MLYTEDNWQTDEYKNGTPSQRMLYEFSVLKDESEAIEKLKKMYAEDSSDYVNAESRRLQIRAKMYEIEKRYPIVLDAEEGTIDDALNEIMNGAD